jgi:hypothetical protein
VPAHFSTLPLRGVLRWSSSSVAYVTALHPKMSTRTRSLAGIWALQHSLQAETRIDPSQLAKEKLSGIFTIRKGENP